MVFFFFASSFCYYLAVYTHLDHFLIYLTNWGLLLLLLEQSVDLAIAAVALVRGKHNYYHLMPLQYRLSWFLSNVASAGAITITVLVLVLWATRKSRYREEKIFFGRADKEEEEEEGEAVDHNLHGKLSYGIRNCWCCKNVSVNLKFRFVSSSQRLRAHVDHCDRPLRPGLLG